MNENEIFKDFRLAHTMLRVINLEASLILVKSGLLFSSIGVGTVTINTSAFRSFSSLSVRKSVFPITEDNSLRLVSLLISL